MKYSTIIYIIKYLVKEILQERAKLSTQFVTKPSILDGANQLMNRLEQSTLNNLNFCLDIGVHFNSRNSLYSIIINNGIYLI